MRDTAAFTPLLLASIDPWACLRAFACCIVFACLTSSFP
jgi:hypothetical protein